VIAAVVEGTAEWLWRDTRSPPVGLRRDSPSRLPPRRDSVARRGVPRAEGDNFFTINSGDLVNIQPFAQKSCTPTVAK